MTPKTSLFFAGSGWITLVHGLAAQANYMPVVAVASRNPANAATRAKSLNARPCQYDDSPAGASTAIVCTNPQRHLEDARLALHGGARVIVEKPLTRTLAQADELVALAAAHGQRVGYGENMAFAPIVVEALARIATLGKLHHIEARALNQRPTWGDFLTSEWGGGALYDLGAHPLALAVLMARAADPFVRPVAVRAQLHGADDTETDVHAEAWITFSSDATAHIEASWTHSSPTWDMQASSDTGVVHATIMPTPELSFNGEPVALASPKSPLEQFGYVEQLRNLDACMTAGATPMMNAAFGREILDITCGAYASARIGETVTLPFAGDRTKSPLELWRPPGGDR